MLSKQVHEVRWKRDPAPSACSSASSRHRVHHNVEQSCSATARMTCSKGTDRLMSDAFVSKGALPLTALSRASRRVDSSVISGAGTRVCLSRWRMPARAFGSANAVPETLAAKLNFGECLLERAFRVCRVTRCPDTLGPYEYVARLQRIRLWRYGHLHHHDQPRRTIDRDHACRLLVG